MREGNSPASYFMDNGEIRPSVADVYFFTCSLIYFDMLKFVDAFRCVFNGSCMAVSSRTVQI